MPLHHTMEPVVSSTFFTNEGIDTRRMGISDDRRAAEDATQNASEPLDAQAQRILLLGDQDSQQAKRGKN